VALAESQKEEYKTCSTGGEGICAFCPGFIVLYDIQGIKHVVHPLFPTYPTIVVFFIAATDAKDKGNQIQF